MYLDSRALFLIARHVKRFENLPRPRLHRSRHVPRATQLLRKLLLSQIFIVRAAGAPLSSPTDFPFAGAELLLPAQFGTSWFWLRVLLPRIFPYAAVFLFCDIFHPLLQWVSCFLAASFAANLPPRARQFGCKSPVCQTAVFSTCLLHHDLVGSVSAFLLVQVISLHHSGGSGTRWLVRGFLRGPSSPRSIKSLPYLLHCCRKFFSSSSEFRFVRLPDRVCQYFYVAFRFLEKFASSSVLTWICFTCNCSISSSHSTFTRYFQ